MNYEKKDTKTVEKRVVSLISILTIALRLYNKYCILRKWSIMIMILYWVFMAMF